MISCFWLSVEGEGSSLGGSSFWPTAVIASRTMTMKTAATPLLTASLFPGQVSKSDSYFSAAMTRLRYFSSRSSSGASSRVNCSANPISAATSTTPAQTEIGVSSGNMISSRMSSFKLTVPPLRTKQPSLLRLVTLASCRPRSPSQRAGSVTLTRGARLRSFPSGAFLRAFAIGGRYLQKLSPESLSGVRLIILWRKDIQPRHARYPDRCELPKVPGKTSCRAWCAGSQHLPNRRYRALCRPSAPPFLCDESARVRSTHHAPRGLQRVETPRSDPQSE